jgi:hypothetical protein
MSRPQIYNLPEVNENELIPVRVKVRQLDYITRTENMLGDEVDVIKTAYGPGDPRLQPTNDLDMESQEFADAQSDYQKGQLVLLRPQQYEGLMKAGAVTRVDFDGDEEVEPEEELLDVSTASADDLALWITQERPTVNDVVQASGGDPDIAQKLLEAESKAQNGEPRKGVLEGLSAVISRSQ